MGFDRIPSGKRGCARVRGLRFRFAPESDCVVNWIGGYAPESAPNWIGAAPPDAVPPNSPELNRPRGVHGWNSGGSNSGACAAQAGMKLAPVFKFRLSGDDEIAGKIHASWGGGL